MGTCMHMYAHTEVSMPLNLHGYSHMKKCGSVVECQWLMPVSLAIQETDIRRIQV
jgi:hypothetical protein